jgi:hypothetical protein
MGVEKGKEGGRVAVFAYRPPWRAGPGRPLDIWCGPDTPAKNASYSTAFFTNLPKGKIGYPTPNYASAGSIKNEHD